MAGVTRSKGRVGRPWRRARQICLSRRPLICGRCGQPIDPRLRFPDRYSGTAGHIIALSLGGHPTDQANLQPEHLTCNSAAGNGQRATTPASRRW